MTVKIEDNKGNLSSRILLPVFVMALVAVVILVGGFLFYRDQERQMHQRVKSGLSIVAQLKAEQIAEWRVERLTDANMLVGSPFFTEGVEKYMASPTDTEAKDKVLDRLAIIAKSYPYQDMLLTDVNGSVLLSLNDSVHRLSDITLAQMAVAIEERKAVITDLHIHPVENAPHLDVIAPLFPWGQDSPQAIGAVVFCIDPSQYLYPLLQSLPMPSETAETLLVERDGDHVLLLNDLRHREGVALKLRTPLSRRELPAVMAVLGKEGIVQGKDYREVEVLAVLKHIPDSPWYMVAKIDTDEALAGWRFRAGIITALIAGLLVAGLAVTGLIWQRRQRLAYQALYQAEEKYRTIMEEMGDAYFEVDLAGNFTNVNDAHCSILGYSQKDMLGMNFRTVTAQEDIEVAYKVFNQVYRTGKPVKDHPFVFVRKDGNTDVAELSISPLQNAAEKMIGFRGIGRDITERKRAEETLNRSEQNFRDSIENSPLGIRIVTADGETIYANRALLDIYGYSSIEELKAVPTRERYTPESYAQHQERKEKRSRGEFVPSNYEISIVRQDGEVRHLVVSRGEVQWNGKRQFQVAYQDITERRKAEETIKRQLSEIASYYDDAPIGLAILDTELRFLRINNTLAEINGIPAAEHVGKTVKDIVPALESQAREVTSEIIKTGKAVTNIEFAGETKAQPGVERTWLEGWYPLKDDDKKIIGFTVMVQDITERKTREQEYQAIIRTTIDGFWQADMQGHFLDVNEAYCHLTGYSRDELLNMAITDVEAVEKPEETAARIQKIKEVGYDRFESRHRRKNGGIVEVEISVNYLPTDGGLMFVFIRNITERRKAEETLRQSEERYRAIIEDMDEGYFELDMAGNFTLVNDAHCCNVGYTREELAGMHYSRVVHEEDPEAVRKGLKRMFKTGQPSLGLHRKILRKDGSIRFAEVSMFPLRSEDGKIIGFRGIAWDITDRKQAEETLQQSEEKYRTILKEIEDSYFEVDLAGNLSFVNDATCRILGYSRKELLGMNYRGFTVEEYIKDTYQAFNQVYRTGKPNRGFPWKIARKDGSTGFAEATISVVRNPKGEIIGFRGVGRDITARKRAEDDIRRSEAELSKSQQELRNLSVRLQLLREEERTSVAREIHDELGQALTALRMDLSWLSKRLPEESEALLDKTESMVKVIDTTAQAVRRISTNLRPEMLDDLGLVAAMEWLAGEFRERTGTKLKVTFEPEEIVVEKDLSTAIFRIFQELLTNVSRHARATRIVASLKEKAGMLELRVRDNGRGIKEKQISGSKSLGLVGIRERAYLFGGKVEIKGTPGKGTAVIVRIPGGGRSKR